MMLKRKDLSEYQKWAYNQSHTKILMIQVSILKILRFIIHLPIFAVIGIVSVLHYIVDKFEDTLYDIRSYLEDSIAPSKKIRKLMGICDLYKYSATGMPQRNTETQIT